MLIFVLLAWFSCPLNAALKQKRPNIVFIAVDDLVSQICYIVIYLHIEVRRFLVELRWKMLLR